jgi:hypothetical protein
MSSLFILNHSAMPCLCVKLTDEMAGGGAICINGSAEFVDDLLQLGALLTACCRMLTAHCFASTVIAPLIALAGGSLHKASLKWSSRPILYGTVILRFFLPLKYSWLINDRNEYL